MIERDLICLNGLNATDDRPLIDPASFQELVDTVLENYASEQHWLDRDAKSQECANFILAERS